MCRGGGLAVVKLTTFGCCDLFKSGLFTTGRAFMHQVSKSFWTTGGKGENGRLTVCFMMLSHRGDQQHEALQGHGGELEEAMPCPPRADCGTVCTDKFLRQVEFLRIRCHSQDHRHLLMRLVSRGRLGLRPRGGTRRSRRRANPIGHTVPPDRRGIARSREGDIAPPPPAASRCRGTALRNRSPADCGHLGL